MRKEIIVLWYRRESGGASSYLFLQKQKCRGNCPLTVILQQGEGGQFRNYEANSREWGGVTDLGNGGERRVNGKIVYEYVLSKIAPKLRGGDGKNGSADV